jgi:hypothetical protein
MQLSINRVVPSLAAMMATAIDLKRPSKKAPYIHLAYSQVERVVP